MIPAYNYTEPTVPDPPTDEAPGTPGRNPTLCFGSVVKVCLAELPQQRVALDADGSIDTDTSSRCVATTNDVSACVIAGTEIGVGANITVVGARPLILVATTGAITVNGGLDVSSKRGD